MRALAQDGSGVKKTVKVIVHDAPKTVYLKNGTTTVKGGSVNYLYAVGATLSLTASVSPSKAYQGIEWTSNNETVATVENGVVTAVGYGTAKITAKTVDGKNKSTTIYVMVGAPAEQVVISGARTVLAGKTTTLSAQVLPAEAVNKSVSWKVDSGYEAYASVSSSGVVKGKKAGYAKITASAPDQGVSESYYVYVMPKSTKVSIYSGDVNITGKTAMMYRNLGGGWYLLDMDGELWMLETHENERMGQYVWSIYALRPLGEWDARARGLETAVGEHFKK